MMPRKIVTMRVKTQVQEAAEYLVCVGERIGEPWSKKLVANGAIIAVTAEECRSLALRVEEMAGTGKQNDDGCGSFALY